MPRILEQHEGYVVLQIDGEWPFLHVVGSLG